MVAAEMIQLLDIVLVEEEAFVAQARDAAVLE